MDAQLHAAVARRWPHLGTASANPRWPPAWRRAVHRCSPLAAVAGTRYQRDGRRGQDMDDAPGPSERARVQLRALELHRWKDHLVASRSGQAGPVDRWRCELDGGDPTHHQVEGSVEATAAGASSSRAGCRPRSGTSWRNTDAINARTKTAAA